jgi:hypothetical protein
LSVTCGRSVVFSGYWPYRYDWNIVESGVKHHKPNLLALCLDLLGLMCNDDCATTRYGVIVRSVIQPDMEWSWDLWYNQIWSDREICDTTRYGVIVRSIPLWVKPKTTTLDQYKDIFFYLISKEKENKCRLICFTKT